MKRLALLLAPCVFAFMLIGCGEQAAPPGGKMSDGPVSGPATKGEAAKVREKILENMNKVGPHAK
jgi:hypothetical protein